MKYKICRLDGRFSYRDYFEYYIGFSSRMTSGQGPLQFNHALKWFMDTYGWSAEVRDYMKIMQWTQGPTQTFWNHVNLARTAASVLTERSEHCNPYWSWTNGHDDLRIYVASSKELAFFRLSHPVDQ